VFEIRHCIPVFLPEDVPGFGHDVLAQSLYVCVCVCVCVRVSEGETERIENISPSLK